MSTLPHPELVSGSQRLLQRLEENENWLSFEAFMETALYDPETGYYAAKIRDVGRSGDFSTSAEPDSLLAKAIAQWACQIRKRVNPGLRWHLIELGGGNGEMAATILKSLGFVGRFGLTYHLVEISAPLRQRQQEKLRGFRVCWHQTGVEALQAAGGNAVIFSNELVDAYPCVRLIQRDGEWSELGICAQAGRIVESVRPLHVLRRPELRSSVLDWPAPLAGQIAEIHADYREDLLQMAQNLIRGSLLTIDYGDTFPVLYHRQPKGTLRGYFHHQRVEGADLYTRIGQQDLTADVNFTDLQTWGLECGLTNHRFETQRDFILRYLGSQQPKNTSEARLLDPIGAGGAFKVLQQNRGI